MAAWERVKRKAWGDLLSGHAAARLLDDVEGLPDLDARAAFISLRDALIKDWQPTGAIELTLIDTYVTAYTLYMFWLGEHATLTGARFAKQEDPKAAREAGLTVLPQVSRVEAIAAAAENADRWHRLMMRTLRQLQNHRRYTSPVSIGRVEQLNLAQQQLNVGRVEGQQDGGGA